MKQLQIRMVGPILLFVSLGLSAALGQTGSIVGQVTDASGAAVPGGQITVKNEGTVECNKPTGSTSVLARYHFPSSSAPINGSTRSWGGGNYPASAPTAQVCPRPYLSRIQGQ